MIIKNNKVKAYKLLAKQENISNNQAKMLIDSGLVSFKSKRVEIARSEFDAKSRFEIIRMDSKTIFQDDLIIAVNKEIGINSYSLEKRYNAKLINRLDKDTSGIILLSKNIDFIKKSINEFKNKAVIKKYQALVYGKLCDEVLINKKVQVKKGQKAVSFISSKGEEALSLVRPLQIIDNSTLVEVEIKTGRTHQIRVHLASINHPIIGDVIYNKLESKTAKRLYLHCFYTKIFDYEFTSPANFNI